jgi:hypothetical protein
MVFAALLLLCPLPQIGATAKTDSGQPALVSSIPEKDSSLSPELPSMPVPKVKSGAPESGSTPDEVATSTSTARAVPGASVVSKFSISPQPIVPASPAFQPSALKPAISYPHENERDKKIWYALAITSSGAATLDAWSTRRALSRNDGTEANPLLRPFAHSGMLYAATQVSPLLMDYLGKRMMVSRYGMVRRVWWVPQSVGTGVSLFAGVHNIGIVH